STSKIPSRAAMTERDANTSEDAIPSHSSAPRFGAFAGPSRVTPAVCHADTDSHTEHRDFLARGLKGFQRVRYVRIVFFLLGVGGLAFLVARIGPDAVAAAFAELRWWQFILVCLPYGVIMIVDTL